MISNNFVASLKSQGKILRELNGREVRLPFDNEYSIILKNKNNRKACCNIKIDGKDIGNGHELILNAYDQIELERPFENQCCGNKFKFVSIGNENVSDKENPENGLIEIEFWLEKYRNFAITNATSNIPWIYYGPYIQPQGTDDNLHHFSPNTSNLTCNYASITPTSNVGATVDGSHSNQHFYTEYFYEKEYPSTVLKLWIRGSDKMLTVDNELHNDFHCTGCGKKVEYTHKYCSRCGLCSCIR